ncbi:aminoglycoside 3'-phosphotransferase [Schumannella luteola]|uniref:Kanamycin kinase n=1 Tax=Schumannella luteola TaxID=472059 RepID=A0A852YMA5_9MICO|nr:phosphotransferase [Schumannella luteola]NYH00319.1 kanamycin kinase [Schumannella luteola]TPX05994.1 phosphotransferase [Schumannella luteola]
MTTEADPHDERGRDLTAAPDLSYQLDPSGFELPAVIARLAAEAGAEPRALWQNSLGGLTFRLGDRVVKWSPPVLAESLRREEERMRWLDGRHPAPRVLDAGADDDGAWLVTAALDGDTAVSDANRARPEVAIAAIVEGLRRIHTLPLDDVPGHWADETWVGRQPQKLAPRPPIDDPVLVHGDACAPNTLLDAAGAFAAHVDLGDLAPGDRWADLAVASMSLEWNYGPGHDDAFYAAYGIEPDAERIRWYRQLWEAES